MKRSCLGFLVLGFLILAFHGLACAQHRPIVDPLLSSSLCDAARQGNLDLLCRLLDKGGDPNTTDHASLSLLMIATTAGQVETVTTLLARGANVNAKTSRSSWLPPVSPGWTALMYAVQVGNPKIARILLDASANPNVRSETGTVIPFGSPIIAAAGTGRSDIVALMLDAGARINDRIERKDSWISGETPLMRAAAGGHTDTVRLLLDRGADVNLKAADLRTALHLAVLGGSLPCIELLLSRGADHAAEDKHYKTALDYAVEKEYDSIATRLRQFHPPRQVTIEPPRSALATPAPEPAALTLQDELTAAVRADDTVRFRELLKKGAKIVEKDSAGRWYFEYSDDPKWSKLHEKVSDEEMANFRDPEVEALVGKAQPKEYTKATFFQVHENFIDPASRLTELQQQEIWKVMAGKWVRWSGRIIEVGVTQGRPYIAVDMGLEATRPDILLETDESIDKLTLLVKGRRIFFTARLLTRPTDGKAVHLHEAKVHAPAHLTDFFPLEFVLPKRALSFATPSDYDEMRQKIGNDPRRVAPVKAAFRQGKAAFIPAGAWMILTGKTVGMVSEAHLYGDKDQYWLLNRDLRDLGIPISDAPD